MYDKFRGFKVLDCNMIFALGKAYLGTSSVFVYQCHILF